MKNLTFDKDIALIITFTFIAELVRVKAIRRVLTRLDNLVQHQLIVIDALIVIIVFIDLLTLDLRSLLTLIVVVFVRGQATTIILIVIPFLTTAKDHEADAHDCNYWIEDDFSNHITFVCESMLAADMPSFRCASHAPQATTAGTLRLSNVDLFTVFLNRSLDSIAHAFVYVPVQFIALILLV